ncbi:MAG TPA: mercuric transporter MerT family protein [Nitrospirales bacterium]|nr:mercury transporter MerT [Nitrospiraceae bacterium]HNP30310.1 mercuric transporter MerT family protein [Nitrospirales bacterium]
MHKKSISEAAFISEKSPFQESEGARNFKEPASIASVGGIIAAFLASLCCIGPVLFAALGVGVGATGFLANTAGFLKAFVPYRPFFIVVALVAIGAGFYLVYRRPKAPCASDAHCTDSRTGSKSVVLLWLATVLTLFFVLSPYWLGIFK